MPNNSLNQKDLREKVVKNKFKTKFFSELKWQCPHCYKDFWFFKKEKRFLFCPHCQKSIVLKPKIIKPLCSKKTSIYIGLLVFIIGCILLNTPYNYIKETTSYILTDGLAILYLIVAIIFGICWLMTQPKTYNTLAKGVDDIQIIKQEKVNYHIVLQQTPYVHCPECHSYRLVELYWYRRHLAENSVQHNKTSNNMANLPDIFTNDEKSFVGCLHCQQTFRYKISSKQEWVKVLIMIGGMLTITFILPVFTEYIEMLNLKNPFMLLLLVFNIYIFKPSGGDYYLEKTTYHNS